MKRLNSYKDVLNTGDKAIAVKTNGMNSNIIENQNSYTGFWRVGINQTFNKVIVFKEVGNENFIYIGDYTNKVVDENKFIIHFTNTRLVGKSNVTWTEFCEKRSSGFERCYLSV